jgi:predicted ribonuclease YlaK
MNLEEQLKNLDYKKIIILTPSVLLADAPAALGAFSFTKKDSSTLLLYGHGILDSALASAYKLDKNPTLQDAADIFYDVVLPLRKESVDGRVDIVNDGIKKKTVQFLDTKACKTAEERIDAVKELYKTVKKKFGQAADVEIISLDKSELLTFLEAGLNADTWREVSINSYDNLPAGWTILQKEGDFLNWRLDHNAQKLIIDGSDQKTLEKNTEILYTDRTLKKLDGIIAMIDQGKEVNMIDPERVEELLDRPLLTNNFVLIPHQNSMIVLYNGMDKKGRRYMRTPQYIQKIKELFKTPKEYLRGVLPRNVFQVMYVDLLLSDLDMVVGFGPAGTGKSFLPLAYVLDAIDRPIKENLNAALKRARLKNEGFVLYPLSTVEEDIGYLPGGLAEKTGPHQQAILANLNKLMENKARLDDLLGIKLRDGNPVKKENALLSLITASFLRGTTYDHAAFLVDEAQNFSYQTLKTIVTRMGENTSLIIDADPWQGDRHLVRGYNGFVHFLKAVFDNKRLPPDPGMAALYLPKFANERSEFSRRVQDYLL